jgi:hypothetical protein
MLINAVQELSEKNEALEQALADQQVYNTSMSNELKALRDAICKLTDRGPGLNVATHEQLKSP